MNYGGGFQIRKENALFYPNGKVVGPPWKKAWKVKKHCFNQLKDNDPNW